MTSDTMEGKVQTVLGPVDADRLGVTLTHEHLLWDPTDVFAPPAQAGLRDLYYRRIAPDAPGLAETLGRIRRDAAVNLDNCRLLDVSAAIEGAMLFKQFGGQTIVDTTSLGSGRDPVGLARIARATGLNVVMGGSYYIDSLHPPEVDALSEEELTERIVREVTEGSGRHGDQARRDWRDRVHVAYHRQRAEGAQGVGQGPADHRRASSHPSRPGRGVSLRDSRHPGRGGGRSEQRDHGAHRAHAVQTGDAEAGG